ncbi:hypothetical protein AVENP_1624 [Arcobacter venerupis]|uniref:Uncharacterized protein n=1 Tax=Arcobacter venerupis TaxID=1054033 RepID=A0AAE7BAY8_9BACT|nr:hypothetical protein [Arcobacter venerupis]QKF67170.1 hypothetical protein AVENP_1624 [Arcobacter venerupis]RWS48382.1 hypothetical protein CKA56_14165 [Arcobacter venerupis]
MEKEEILISTNYQHVLIHASVDNKLTANQFRVLFYICTNIENVYIEEMKTKLNIRTNNSIADCIKVLIKNQYIKRVKNKRLIKKGVAFYTYEINIEKPILPNNINSFFSNTYFKSIDEIFSYFFEKIPTTKKIDISVNRKQIELLIYKDDYSIQTIKDVIDYVSISHNRSIITRPILLRKHFKALFKELNELSNKSK